MAGLEIFKRLTEGLTKTRQGLERRLSQVFAVSKPIGPKLLESIEEVLIEADLGTSATQRILSKIQKESHQPDLGDPDHLKACLQKELLGLFQESGLYASSAQSWRESADRFPHTVLVVGVNGVGKTTTIGKLAANFRAMGKTVLLAAADTFRAAAIEQLEVWAKRARCEVVRQQPGSDPSAVAFDTVTAAKARNVDLVLVDTAGRLHTQFNLMEELKKIKRAMAKALPGSPHEVLLILDATTGQNALVQARMFHEAVGVTGLVMTKLDGTAKGGILIAILEELKIPIRYVGVGEGTDDLLEFDPVAYVEGLIEAKGSLTS